tara:strand:+ start:1087 stop:1431 length:345 start_codon:yes stop_codon:yes gene_type:complete
MEDGQEPAPFYVFDEERPEWHAEFFSFRDAFKAAAKLEKGEVFHRIAHERIAGRCADCEEFRGSSDWSGADWSEGDGYRKWDWVCSECLEMRQDSIDGGCGACTRASFCHCRGY